MSFQNLKKKKKIIQLKSHTSFYTYKKTDNNITNWNLDSTKVMNSGLIRGLRAQRGWESKVKL